MSNGLIECPVCAKLGKKQILGRVMENGHFLVLRFHHGTTIIKASSYTIVCGCGYELTVTSGTALYNTPQLPISGQVPMMI